MVTPRRTFSAGNQYRYGFNGKENDPSINSGAVDFGARIYDGRIGKFFSVDSYASNFIGSPYQFAGNNPIQFIDYNGDFKISPFFVKRYPNLARVLAYIIPSFKDNVAIRDKWLYNMGFAEKDKSMGIEVWNDMVTFGKGPFVDPSRPSKEFNSNINALASFFGEWDGGQEDISSEYKNNLTIGRRFAEELETAIKKGNSYDIAFKIFSAMVLCLHEGSHWGRGFVNIDEGRGEYGKFGEDAIFGTHFTYRAGEDYNKTSGSQDAFNATGYASAWFHSIYKSAAVTLIGGSKLIKLFNSMPTPKGQAGDKTIKDNHDDENRTPPKVNSTGSYKPETCADCNDTQSPDHQKGG